jgi:hypothetical protein
LLCAVFFTCRSDERPHDATDEQSNEGTRTGTRLLPRTTSSLVTRSTGTERVSPLLWTTSVSDFHVTNVPTYCRDGCAQLVLGGQGRERITRTRAPGRSGAWAVALASGTNAKMATRIVA